MNAEIAGGLDAKRVHVWKSTAAEQFIEQPSIQPENGKFAIALEAIAIYTLTTTTGQKKGCHAAPPAKAFPFPYKDGFESSPVGSLPKYFSDQKGSFEVVMMPGRGKVVKQIVTKPGYVWVYMKKEPKPYSVIGDASWSDYAVSADVLIDAGDVELGGRFGPAPAGVTADANKLSYRFSLDKVGAWRLLYRDKVLASGAVRGFDGAAWHRMTISFSSEKISAVLDGKALAQVSDGSAQGGLAYVASTYNPNLFDNISIGNSDR